jgi:hypothetical protein
MLSELKQALDGVFAQGQSPAFALQAAQAKIDGDAAAAR